MTTINTSKKQLVLVLMSGFFASAIVGCNGGSSGSSTAQPSKTLAAMPDLPLRYSLVKATKEDTIATKNKRKNNKLQLAKNGKSLQDALDDVTNATNFLNIFAVAAPEIGFITAPATFIEGIYSSDGLDTQLSDITNTLQIIGNDLQAIQGDLNTQESEIAHSVVYTATATESDAMSSYNNSYQTTEGLWGNFTSGLPGSTANTIWYPSQKLGTSTATYPDAYQFGQSVGVNYATLDPYLGNILGFSSDEHSGAFSLVSESGLTEVLNAELNYFKATEFQLAYGQPIGHNVASDIAAYNKKISNYYYNGLALIQQMYIMQKTANILSWQAQNQYTGPLSGIAPVDFIVYPITASYTSESQTADFNTAQENLDNWAIGAANQLFSVITPYIISDTPFTNPSNGADELYYPYGESNFAIQQQWMGIGYNGEPIPGTGIVPNMVKTQSLVNPVISSGMPQITQSSTTQFVFYVEQGLGNPNQYIQAYQAAWNTAGGPTTFTQSNINSVFAWNANGDVASYIATPGYYDGESLQMYTSDINGNQFTTASTNLANRCSNGGSSITLFNDGGTVNGQTYTAKTYGWSCPTNPNPSYTLNSINGLGSNQVNSDDYVFGLMSPDQSSFNSINASNLLATVTINNNNTIVNNLASWSSSISFGVYNLSMSIGSYNFAPTFTINTDVSGVGFVGNMYCGAGDPLCTIDPVSNQICVAGNVVGLNWINQGTFMFGVVNPTTNQLQHCYNS